MHEPCGISGILQKVYDSALDGRKGGVKTFPEDERVLYMESAGNTDPCRPTNEVMLCEVFQIRIFIMRILIQSKISMRLRIQMQATKKN